VASRHRLDDALQASAWRRPVSVPRSTNRNGALLGIAAHIDDDPRTAYHLANNGVERVYLLDHAGAHGDAPPPPHLTLVRSLQEFAEAIAPYA
jgi:hypothetical protein